jgi:hypothetical protein
LVTFNSLCKFDVVGEINLKVHSLEFHFGQELELIGGHGVCVERFGQDLKSVRIDLLARSCCDCQVGVLSVHLLIVFGEMNHFKRFCSDVVNFKSNSFRRKSRVELRIDSHSLARSEFTIQSFVQLPIFTS